MKLNTRVLRARRIVVVAAALAVCGISAGVAVAVTNSGGTYVPQLGITVPDSKLQAVVHAYPDGSTPESSVPAPVPPKVVDRIPAHILPASTPIPVPPSLIQVTNAWLVSDGVTLVAVYAGKSGANPDDGRFVIIRQNEDQGVQTQDVVDVPGSGAVSLDSTPAGTGVETSAQHGRLHFTGAHGRAGNLDLEGDSASEN